MKKSIALVAAAFGVSSVFAQDLTSKKGEPFLPEAGDWAVSIDATPFLNYAGNFFGKTTANAAPTFNFMNGNNMIVGKYFKDATTAYRVGLRLGFGNATEKRNVAALPSSANPYPTGPTTVENKYSRATTNVGVSVGMEKRKGKSRLQGFYGADAGIFIGSSKDKYSYGNALSAISGTGSVNVASADGFGSDIDATVAGTQYANVYDNLSSAYNFPNFSGGSTANPASARMTEKKSGVSVSFGVRAFIGAEYFILPKVSLGGEFGWGLGLSMTGKSTTTWESIGVTTGSSAASVGSTEVVGGKSSTFGLDTDGRNGVFGPSASLRLALHF
jgi:hypothetical protein